MVRFPSYCFLCNNEKGEQSRGMNPCPGILLRWSLEDRWGKCLRGLKYQFKTSFSAHYRKTTFRPRRRSQGHKRTHVTIYWSCLKNAVDKAGVGWYSCVLLKSQRCTAVHLLGKRCLGGSPRAATYDLLGKADRISKPVCGLEWKVATVGRDECIQAARPRKIRSPALEVKESCPGCVQCSRGCCATHPGQTHQVTPSYFLLHKSVLRKQQWWCNYLSGYSTGHKVSDTAC